MATYSDLGQAEQKAFLDIGCFLVGEEEKLTIEILNGLHGIRSEPQLESLRRRGFVDDTIQCMNCGKRENPSHGDNYCCGSLKAITMPDTMMDLARALGETGSQPLRLASSIAMDRFLMNVRTDFQGWVSGEPPPKICGIRFSYVPTCRRRVIVEGLRLFVAEDLAPAFFDFWKISGALLWLRLFKLRRSLCFPSSISLETLRVLELDGAPDGVQHFMRNSAYDAGRRRSIFDFFPRSGSGQSIFSIWKRNSVFQYLKAKNRVRGMEDLTKLELTNIKSIQSLPINFSLLGNLTTLDVSGCVGLTALPSTSKTLSRLQYLVNLKFLNISKCSNLKTLNVHGLISLEEIKADACWNLENIVDLDSLDRLNCLHISTDNRLMWTDILNYLHQQNPSTAVFSGKAANGRVVDTENIEQILTERYPEIEIYDFRDGLRLNLDGGAIMIFIIDEGRDASSPEFCLTFTPTNNGSALEYRTARANGGGRILNVFMLTEGSHLFEENQAHDIHVRCSPQSRINPGLIVRLQNNLAIPDVCAAIINTYL